MRYMCEKDFNVNGFLVGVKGDEVEVENAENVRGCCEITNLTTNEKYIATWLDIEMSSAIVWNEFTPKLTTIEKDMIKSALIYFGDKLADAQGYSEGEKYWDLAKKF